MEFDVFQVVPDEKGRVVRKSNYHPNISREVLILDDCDDEAFSPLLSPDIRSDNRLSGSISRGAAAQEKFGKCHLQVILDEKGRVVRKSKYHPKKSRELFILDNFDDEAFSPSLFPDIRPDNRLSESISRGAAAQEKFGKYHSIEHLSNEDKNNSEVKIIDQTDQVENTHENELDQDKFDHDYEVIILEVIN